MQETLTYNDVLTLQGDPVDPDTVKCTERVIKVCNSCGSHTETQWRKAQASYQKWGRVLCGPCTRSRDNQPIRLRHGRRIKSGTPGNYVEIWDERRGRYVGEHHLVLEEATGHDFLDNGWLIHHIDGRKDNNDPENLYALESNKDHRLLHGQLERVAFELVRRGVIQFSHNQGEYQLAPEVDISTLPASLGFEDVALAQQRGEVKSRSDVDITSEVIRGVALSSPLIAANMNTVTNPQFCVMLRELGALGVLHRVADEQTLKTWTQEIADSVDWIAVSVGVGMDQVGLAKSLIRSGANIIFIDVAHGYTDPVLDTGRAIRKFSAETKIVVGNTTHYGLFAEASDFADAIKVGIAQGFACETKNTAGVTDKQLSALFKCAAASRTYGLPMISDGGVREPADFVKALAAGASSIMAGKIFAACPESAAPLVDGKKVYAGMASRYVQEKWHGEVKNVAPEGGTRYLELGEPVSSLVGRYNGALRSGISYVGATDIKELRQNAEWLRVSTHTAIESGTRV